MWYSLLKPLLFRFDAEAVHERTLGLMNRLQRSPLVPGLLSRVYRFSDSRLKQELMGLRFPNPVGLAAGFDKNAKAVDLLASLGFGHVEVGAVTADPQEGNPRPRLFRLPKDQALINRMGFNNEGAESVSKRLREVRTPIPVGVNIGKNKLASNPVENYLKTFRRLREQGDYFVVNVSSPNTPGLRELQKKTFLMKILEAIQSENAARKPLLVKVSPDLTEPALGAVAEVSRELKLDGLIAVNTTTTRKGLTSRNPVKNEDGGLSGRPLRQRATRCIDRLYRLTRGGIPIVGVGGVFNGRDAYRKIRAGASLIQLYTGLVYRGPSIAGAINRELVECLDQDGFDHVSEAVGVDSGKRA